MSKLSLAVIIVAYHTSIQELNNLKKEFRKNKLQARFFIIDNSQNNRGFAAAANIGIKKALFTGSNTFIVCNPDIHSLSCSEESIAEALLHFDIFGGVIKQNSKTYYGGALDYWTMAGSLRENKPNNRFHPCDFVSGSFMCFSRKVIDALGYIPERYFMYYEDVAFCYSAKENNLRIGITTSISYSHTEISRTNVSKAYYLARNRLSFLFTYGSLAQKIHECLRFPVSIVRLLSTRNTVNSLQLRAYQDFLYGKEIPHQL